MAVPVGGRVDVCAAGGGDAGRARNGLLHGRVLQDSGAPPQATKTADAAAGSANTTFRWDELRARHGRDVDDVVLHDVLPGSVAASAGASGVCVAGGCASAGTGRRAAAGATGCCCKDFPFYDSAFSPSSKFISSAVARCLFSTHSDGPQPRLTRRA